MIKINVNHMFVFQNKSRIEDLLYYQLVKLNEDKL